MLKTCDVQKIASDYHCNATHWRAASEFGHRKREGQ